VHVVHLPRLHIDVSDNGTQLTEVNASSLTRILCQLTAVHTGCFKKVALPPKTFLNMFTPVKPFCVKFCKFVGNSYPHIHVPTIFFVNLS